MSTFIYIGKILIFDPASVYYVEILAITLPTGLGFIVLRACAPSYTSFLTEFFISIINKYEFLSYIRSVWKGDRSLNISHSRTVKLAPLPLIVVDQSQNPNSHKTASDIYTPTTSQSSACIHHPGNKMDPISAMNKEMIL